MTRILSTLVALIGLSLATAADKPIVIELWPGAAPGEKGNVGKESVLEPGNDPTTKRVTNVTKPTIAVFPAAKDKNTGAAVLIAPGGGYNILAWDKEGEEVAAWLNSIGVTGVVLKYRVPRRPDDAKDKPPAGALQDAQRAMSLVRAKAADWGIDPKRIGMLGFSAGGHLTAWTATNSDRRAYDAADEMDKVSCRPDFVVLVYPGYLTVKDKDELAADIRVTKDSPPAFFVHAANDPVAPQNSVVMWLALKKAKVPAELHIYASGGHGFGLRPSPHTVTATWPARCADWMKGQGFLDK